MACQIVKTKGAVFAVWGRPEVADVDRVVAAITETAQQAGKPIVYLTRVPQGAPAPEGAAKRRMDEILDPVLKNLSSYHVVFEGEGFGAAFKRGVLTNLLQPFWRKRMFFVHATCADVKAKLLPEEVGPAQAVLDLARSRGLLTGTLPTTTAAAMAAQ
ncbi:MAG TPA: hypothetical protein VHM70_24895 [Polyangiaceae bacterium]|jgi:hypothetical protein|nr:hypothetical protein [Polyangiaceae bacterium]